MAAQDFVAKIPAKAKADLGKDQPWLADLGIIIQINLRAFTRIPALPPANPDYTAPGQARRHALCHLMVASKTGVFKPIGSGSGTPVDTGRLTRIGR
jgi:hypothetical protein